MRHEAKTAYSQIIIIMFDGSKVKILYSSGKE